MAFRGEVAEDLVVSVFKIMFGSSFPSTGGVLFLPTFMYFPFQVVLVFPFQAVLGFPFQAVLVFPFRVVLVFRFQVVLDSSFQVVLDFPFRAVLDFQAVGGFRLFRIMPRASFIVKCCLLFVFKRSVKFFNVVLS